MSGPPIFAAQEHRRLRATAFFSKRRQDPVAECELSVHSGADQPVSQRLLCARLSRTQLVSNTCAMHLAAG